MYFEQSVVWKLLVAFVENPFLLEYLKPSSESYSHYHFSNSIEFTKRMDVSTYLIKFLKLLKPEFSALNLLSTVMAVLN